MSNNISIIVPVHNGASQGLVECLKSIDKQDIRDKRVIIVDDGSTDNSLDIATNFAANVGWEVVKHDKNKGLAASLNEGIVKSSSEFLLLIHQDCILVHRDAVLKSLDYLQNNPEVVVLVGRQIYNFHTLNFYQTFSEFRLEHFELASDPYASLDLAENVCDLVRRNVFNESDLFDESLKYAGEDWVFSHNLVSLGKQIRSLSTLEYKDTHCGEDSLSKVLSKEYKYGYHANYVLRKVLHRYNKNYATSSYSRSKMLNRLASLILFTSFIIAIISAVFFNPVPVIGTLLVIIILRSYFVLRKRKLLVARNEEIRLPRVKTLIVTLISDFSFSYGFLRAFF